MNDPLQALRDAGALETSKFPPNSRYYRTPVARLERPGKPPISYLKRRFIAPPERFAVLQRHTVVEGDRIDNIAAQYLGDPELYWQIADANGAIKPADLTAMLGRRINITLPEGVPGGPDA